LATSAILVKNGIDDFSEVGGFWSSARRQNDLVDEEFPLLIAQIGIVGFAKDCIHTANSNDFPKTRQEQFPKMPKLPRTL
jgi:hypothetical protein